MVTVVQAYGHSGPRDGDPHVADLLLRTVEGQWAATEALDASLAKLDKENVPYMGSDLAAMTVVYAQKCAALRWQMATAYLDGIARMYRDDPELPQAAYALGDSLCDAARDVSRVAAQSFSNWDSRTKVRLLQAFILEDFKIDQTNIEGAWCAIEVVIDTISEDVNDAVLPRLPARLTDLVRDSVKRLREHREAFELLRREWGLTTMAQNKMQLATAALSHAREVFGIGQRLWAPYLYGSSFAAAMKKPLTLEELGLAEPWILTDPIRRRASEHSSQDRLALAEFWNAVTDKQGTQAIGNQLVFLLKSGRIRRRTGSAYRTVPWSSQYLVRFPISLDKSNFTTGDLITLYVSADALGRITVRVRRAGRVSHFTDLLGL